MKKNRGMDESPHANHLARVTASVQQICFPDDAVQQLNLMSMALYHTLALEGT